MRTTSATSARSGADGPGRRRGDAPQVRSVPVAELTARDVDAWRELAARAIEPNPFFEPDLLVPAADRFRGVRLALVEAGGELIGALPLARTGRWRRIPGPTLGVWRHDDCFLGTPLLAPEAAARAAGAILDHARSRAAAGLVAFEWIGAGAGVEAAVRDAAADRGIEPIVYESFDRAALVRRPAGDYLKDKVSNGRARELRRLRRQLAEALGGPIEVFDRTGDESAVDGFLEAELLGWKGREGTAFGCTPEGADFFRQVCARFGAAGRLQLLVMTAAGVDVAWKVNITAATRPSASRSPTTSGSAGSRPEFSSSSTLSNCSMARRRPGPTRAPHPTTK